MTQYIDKSAVVAEIEKRLKEYRTFPDYQTDSNYMELCEILSFLNTLEVKEVEEETISEDLEYAALLHYPKMSRISEPHGFIPADNKSHYLGDANEDNRKAFIVGAQWQKEQDAIEVKEVDLDKECRKYLTEHFNVYEDDILQSKRSGMPLDTFDVIQVARHFFELSLKTQKGGLHGNKY